MKYIPFLPVFFLALSLHSQPYESIFGNHNTVWTIAWENLDFYGRDTFYVEKDTLFENRFYKKINRKPGGMAETALIREDTVSGKVWSRQIEKYSPDTSALLIYDYSLGMGDSFFVEYHPQPGGYYPVDSVYYHQGRKHIRLDFWISSNEKFTMIEGVGGNAGVLYRLQSGYLIQYLLCAFKDNAQTYANSIHSGDCWPEIQNIDNGAFAVLKIYPNPFSQNLYLNSGDYRQVESVEVYNSKGALVHKGKFEPALDLGFLPPGMYLLHIHFENQKPLKKIVLKF